MLNSLNYWLVAKIVMISIFTFTLSNVTQAQSIDKQELMLTIGQCPLGKPINYIEIDGNRANLCEVGKKSPTNLVPLNKLLVYRVDNLCPRDFTSFESLNITISGQYERVHSACIPESSFAYEQLRFSKNAISIIRFFAGKKCADSLEEVILEDWNESQFVVGCIPHSE